MYVARLLQCQGIAKVWINEVDDIIWLLSLSAPGCFLQITEFHPGGGGGGRILHLLGERGGSEGPPPPQIYSPAFKYSIPYLKTGY